MPQLFQVLRCYNCLVFQIHQTKKSFKWECKMCGEKQSIKRNFGLGTAKDCRQHVQRLNGIQGEKNESSEANRADTDDETDDKLGDIKPNLELLRPRKSKWSDYLEEAEEITESAQNETMYHDDVEVVLDVPRKRTKFGKSNVNGQSKNKHLKTSIGNEEDEKWFAEMHSTETIHSSIYVKPTPVLFKDSATPTPLLHSNIVPSENDPSNKLKSNPLVTQKEKKVVPKFVPPMLNRNSKWAQFVKEDQASTLVIENCLQGNPVPHNTLFSLCEDSDLDNVLFLY